VPKPASLDAWTHDEIVPAISNETAMIRTVVLQAGWAAVYYFGVVAVVRIAGKRLAGQTGTFDLVVLIQLATVLQRMALGDSPAQGFTFLATVMACHLGLARLSAGSKTIRRILHGEARTLVRDGLVLKESLEGERMSHDDLLAGLRKQGYASPGDVKLAVLEETGHLSAVARDDPGPMPIAPRNSGATPGPPLPTRD
jgi:uncharacterized membrane protein YcaP (DUF421 family)